MMKIEIYGFDGCSECVMAKKFLDDKGLDYTYSTDEEKLKEHAGEFGLRSAPVCIIDGQGMCFSDMRKVV